MQNEIHEQLSEQARTMYPDTVAVGQLHWPDYLAGVGDSDRELVKFTKQEKQAMQDRAGGFPATVVLVVTPTQLFVCAYKSARGVAELKNDIKGWSRDQLRVAVSYPYGSADYARIELMTADRRIELDAADAKGVNATFMQAISTA
ncbi:MAG: hypothetical protein WD598_04295 [Acidimicrobiia bacterium]